MKFLECPYCKKQVVKLWELFFPSPFWISKLCRNCNQPVGFNLNTIYRIIFFIIIGIVLGNIIIRIFSINSSLFEALFLLFFILIPILEGRSLFIEKNKTKS